jgi:hypothetical protein
MARAKLPLEPKTSNTELTRLRRENKELRSRLEQIAELANEEELDLDEDEEEEDLDDEDDLDEDAEEEDEEE